MKHLKSPHYSAIQGRPQGLSHQRGSTLVEWMVSITIGLILLAGLTTLIAQQSSTQAELEKSSRQIENGRYAMQLLQEEIQLAGYFGEYSAAGSLTAPTVLPNPCTVSTTDMASALPFAIQGYDDDLGSLTNAATPTPTPPPAPATPPGCELNALNYVPDTDILVIRRVDITPITGSLKIGQVYMQTGLTASGLEFNYVLAASASTALVPATFSLKNKGGVTAAPLREYVVHVYFVSPCNKPTTGSTCSAANTDDGGASIPTLKRMELSVNAGAAAFVTTPLVEGIENMQIDYGFDTSGDGAPDTYLTTAAAVADWANVMAIRVNLLARNNERTAGFADTKTYNLGLSGTTTATGDNFKRRVFSQLVRVVNPSSRRDR